MEDNKKTTINEEKLAKAKEELACKIQPTTFKTDDDFVDEREGVKARAAGQANAVPDFIDEEGRVRMTRFTSAGGCGAKIGPGVLSGLLADFPKVSDPNILIGFESSDDACVYKAREDLCIINTVDYFPPIVDDPYMFGQIAAANALSDVYAMGGQPKLALNLLMFPNAVLPLAAVKAILEGGNDKVSEAGATIVGGHSIDDKEPKYGLSVTGFAHPDDILSNSASAGKLLVLTKKIGSGIMTTAAKVDLLTKEENDEVEATMSRLNKYAWEAMRGVKVDGCTDVTGFSLMGHGAEMARAGGVTLELYCHKVPIFPKAVEMAEMGIIPAGAYRNKDYVGPEVTHFLSKDPNKDHTLRARIDCMYDPQSSGGLLIAVDEKELPRLTEQLGEKGCETGVIGMFKPRTGKYSVEIHD